MPRPNTKNTVAIDLIDLIALVGLIDVINQIEARVFQLVAVDIHCRERLELAHTGACEDRSHLEVLVASYTLDRTVLRIEYILARSRLLRISVHLYDWLRWSSVE